MSKTTAYPGSKAAFGSYQNIINEIPPHHRFISAFGGSGAMEKIKTPATLENTVFELDPETIKKYWQQPGPYKVMNQDFLQWYKANSRIAWPQHVIYCDPPYMLQTRNSGKIIYKHDWSQQQHNDFLATMANSRDMVIISHYECEAYNNALVGWRKKCWPVMTHTGPRMECIYINYPRPTELHEYNHIGANFTDRQRIKRRKQNIVNALATMTPDQKILLQHELQMLLAEVKKHT